MNLFLKQILLFSFLLFALKGHAQVNPLTMQNLSSVNVDEIPDSQISNYLSKAAENGVSTETIYRALQEKGLPSSEIEKLKGRIALIENGKKSSPQSSDTKKSNGQSQSERKYKDEDNQLPTEQQESDLSIFGSKLFSRNSLVFEPNLRIATPSGYIIGPDDEIVVNVYGFSEKSYNLMVDAEGNIYIPQVGPVAVTGLSIEQASNKIRNKLASTIYKAINVGQTRVQITLGKIRSIRVTVIGESKKPGSYTVSSLTTVFNLLYLCGGPSDLGSYRKIELIRGNELKRTIDLYAFLTKGDQKNNVLLQDGDVIRIPYYKTRITLNGNVKSKGKYELIDGETFSDVLSFSGGFADDAYKAAVTIYQFTDSERKIVDLAKSQYATYIPVSSDSVFVGKLLDRYQNKLVIKGAVLRPGAFELTNNISLKDLIVKAGGLKEDVYSQRGSISRVSNNGTALQISFNVDSVMNNQTSLLLKKNDSVTVYSIFDIDNEVSISVEGDINRPGKYKWAANTTLRDVILASGGVTESGDIGNIEIARRIDNINLTALNHLQTEIITVDLSDTTNVKDVVLKPYDVINVRQKAGFTKQRTVMVEGMVINPGRYTLAMSGDKISDLLRRAGGFRANADTTALIIKRLSKKTQTPDDREKVFSKLLNIKPDSLNTSSRIKNEIYKEYDKISIDLNKALLTPNESENMLLEDGDVLTIEQNTNLVKVSGEVYFPTIVPFEKNANLKYYIQKSGSYTDVARRNGTLVIYPDGKAKKVKHFLFFKSYPKVVSRSEIFVPQKSDKNRSRVSLGEWSVVISSLAIIANVIINLRK